MVNKSNNHFYGKIVEAYSESVTLPNSQVIEMDKVCHPGGAAVVALDQDDKVCLLRQYRCVFDQWLWELPAGKIDHQEPPFETAQRELREEAGVTASQWRELGHMVSSPGVFTEKVHLYLAQGLTHAEPAHEDHEVMEIHWLPLAEAIVWCHDNTIVDAKTVIGLQRAGHYLKTESDSR